MKNIVLLYIIISILILVLPCNASASGRRLLLPAYKIILEFGKGFAYNLGQKLADDIMKKYPPPMDGSSYKDYETNEGIVRYTLIGNNPQGIPIYDISFLGKLQNGRALGCSNPKEKMPLYGSTDSPIVGWLPRSSAFIALNGPSGWLYITNWTDANNYGYSAEKYGVEHLYIRNDRTLNCSLSPKVSDLGAPLTSLPSANTLRELEQYNSEYTSTPQESVYLGSQKPKQSCVTDRNKLFPINTPSKAIHYSPDLDGDHISDSIIFFREKYRDTVWIARIKLSYGYSTDIQIEGQQHSRIISLSDINGAGTEVFIVKDSGASAEFVSLYTFRNCMLEHVKFPSGEEAVFEVGGSVMRQSQLICSKNSIITRKLESNNAGNLIETEFNSYKLIGSQLKKNHSLSSGEYSCLNHF